MSYLHFAPNVGRNIFIKEMIELTPTTMKFKGYYHEPEENFPLEKIMYSRKHVYWIRIDSKKQYDIDTSGSFYDEDFGAEICLFPLYTVELQFQVLARDPSKERLDEIYKKIKAESVSDD